MISENLIPCCYDAQAGIILDHDAFASILQSAVFMSCYDAQAGIVLGHDAFASTYLAVGRIHVIAELSRSRKHYLSLLTSGTILLLFDASVVAAHKITWADHRSSTHIR